MSESTPSALGIGRRIRELRKGRGWSAQDLSNRSAEAGWRISRTRISELENGRTTRMSLEQAMGVSAAFGISLDQFASFKTPASAVIIAAEIVASRARLDKALQEGGAA